MYMYVCMCIYIYGHLNCFHILVFVGSAAVLQINFHLFWIYAQEWDCWIIW